MNEKGFLADCMSSIYWILDPHIEDIETPREEYKESCKVIGPHYFLESLIEESEVAGDKEWDNENDIGIYPESIREIVIVHG